MRRAPVLLLAAVATAAFAVSATGATTRTIKLGDDYFVSDGRARSVTVKQNTRVRWNWVGDSVHNVTVKSGPVRFKSKTQTSGTYTKKVTRRGTYRIVCTIHAPGQKMTLRVVR